MFSVTREQGTVMQKVDCNSILARAGQSLQIAFGTRWSRLVNSFLARMGFGAGGPLFGKRPLSIARATVGQ